MRRAEAAIPRLARHVLLLVLALGVSSLAYAQAPTRLVTGTLGGADYWIQKPAGWAGGGLVVYAHGYEGEGPGPGRVQAPVIGGHFERRGIAWAATGYRSRGYRPDWFLDDVLALHDHFVKTHGKPKWTIIHGQSMGGHVAVAALELHPARFQAGFIECGVIDGIGLIDWLYAYTAAAEYFSGVSLLATPRPAFDRLATFDIEDKLGRPGAFTPAGRLFDSVVKHLAGGALPFRTAGMAERWIGNLLPRDPGPARAREFARHADTRHVRYDIDSDLGVDVGRLNTDIKRVVPGPGARSREANPVFAPFTGRIAVPLMTVHETGDFRVPFRLQQDYRRRTVPAGTSHLLVQRAQRKSGHCGFTGTIRERAFDDLATWLERGVVPKGDDVLGDVDRLGRQ
ncbi:MAG: alpha/beta hydrolase family protein [Reyranellaceae bacterium]